MLDDDEELEGEVVEFEDDEDDVVDTEDGGAIVKLDEDEKPGEGEFYANLAESMSEHELNELATTFIELVDHDRDARKKRDEKYEEGIRRTGLGDDAPGGAAFSGASKVVHPMLTEVCVDFSSRAIKELFPPEGAVKSMIVGELTKDRVKKADRKTALMNWQLSTQAQEFRSELEQLLTQVPLGGAQYLKITWNAKRNRPQFLFVAIDDIYLPFAASNFYTAERKTHVQYITTQTYKARVKSGMYRDVDVLPSAMDPDRSASDKATDKVEGRTETAYNEDGLRAVYEISAQLELDGEDPGPYLLTIDKTSQQVLALYRNWNEDDDSREADDWIVEFPFVPWRGAYPIGIVHMIGGLSAAATGALRALLDSAHISNSQTMLKLKGGPGGQSLSLQPTEIAEIEGGLGVDDIRKVAMPLPFNQPSAVLFQLLGFLVDAGKGVVRTTMDDVSESNQNVPVGTTLAKIEQGMVVFSAIHARLHNAMARVLRILHRLNKLYLDEEALEREVGEALATREDFSGPMDVVPVSDPNIFSEAQRFAQVQAVAQRAQLMPQLYDLRKVEERVLKTLKIPDATDLLQPKMTPTEENAVSENVKATLGRPIVAFPEQDHIAHLKAHIAYTTSKDLGMSELIAPKFLPLMMNHLKEHVALWYAQEAFAMADEATAGDLTTMMHETKDKGAKRELDRLIAEASVNVTAMAQSAFAELPPVIAEVMKLMQSLQPQMPQDPATAAAMADIQMRKGVEDQKAQLKTQEMQTRAQSESEKAAAAMAAAEVDKARLQLDATIEQNNAAEAAAKIEMQHTVNVEDNETAVQIAQMQIDSNEAVAVTGGSGDPGPN